MSALQLATSLVVPQAEKFGVDDKGVTTYHWLLPEMAEIIYGGLAAVIIFGALYKFAGPAIKKALDARTERIQKELDASAAAETSAKAEAAQIREAKGDIDGERARLLAEADAQAAQILSEGRARLEVEVAEVLARADAEIAQVASRSGSELRSHISVLSADATEALVARELDPATQNALIEDFIAKVGAA